MRKLFALLILITLYTNCFAQDSLTTKATVSTAPLSDYQMFKKGQTDASRFYRKYKPAGTGTLVTGLVSPLLGLVPAIATSTSKIKDKNLNYPDPVLFENIDYQDGYRKKAKQIKSRKVWKNWMISMGAAIVVGIAVAASGSGTGY